MILWHYTTMRAALEILMTRCLWATDVRYLNDGAEYVLGLEALEAHVARRSVLSAPSENQLKRILRILRQDVRNPSLPVDGPALGLPGLGAAPFVSSFSANSDDLSQWRHYSGAATGAAIGFDRDALSALGEVVECAYASTDEPGSGLTQALDEVLLQIRSLDAYAGTIEDSLVMGLLGPQTPLSRLRARLKHRSFAAENEHRLVTFPGQFMRKVKYRAGNATPIPYCELDFSAAPPVEIWLGPITQPGLARAAIAQLCAGHGWSPEIRYSTSTFRGAL